MLHGTYGAEVDCAGRYLATREPAALWKITNDASSKLVKVSDLPDTKQAIAFSSDGQYLAIFNSDGIQMLKLPELQKSGQALKVDMDVTAVSAGGTYIAGRISDDHGYDALSVFEVSSGREVARMPQSSYIPAVEAFSPDGESLAVFRGGEVEVRRFPSGSDRAWASYNDAVSFLGMTGDENVLVAISRPKQNPGSTGEEYSLVARMSDAATRRERQNCAEVSSCQWRPKL
jgi:hypothetical protein